MDAIAKIVEAAGITTGTAELFVALVQDAPNWAGMPLFGGNVGGDPASKGHLTHLKQAGLLYTETDADDPTCAWVVFTEAGKVLAASAGLGEV